LIGIETMTNDIEKACWAILNHATKQISDSYSLVNALRQTSGLEKLGDIVMDDDASNTSDMIELFRLIQYSKEKTTRDPETSLTHCCLEDIFGYHFGQIIRNIVFGRGNPPLVNKLVIAINEDREVLKNNLLDLAINRELLPKNLLNILNPKTPINRIHNEFLKIDTFLVSQRIIEDYKKYILNLKSAGIKALNRIIESHLRLVFRIAKKRNKQDNSLPLDDIVQEGSVGLLRAAQKYNPTRDTRFMSYAPWWINQAIRKAIDDQSRTIRIPVYMLESINQLNRVSRQLTQEFGREPTHDEIAGEMDITIEKVKEIIKVSQSPISLDPGFLDDSVGDNDLPLDEVASKQLLKEQIEDVLFTLTPREQRVLQLRFGLEDGRSRTLEEVGLEFNVTRERIRQIEAKALRKLRHPSRSRKLKDFLDDPAAYKRKEEKTEETLLDSGNESDSPDGEENDSG